MISSTLHRITGETVLVLQQIGCCHLVDRYRQDGAYAGRCLIDTEILESWEYFQVNHGVIVPGFGLVPKKEAS